MSANPQQHCHHLVWRSRLGACLKVSAHIRVSVHEGGFVLLIRIKTREQGSRVMVMRQENWRHFWAQRMTAALFRPHCSEAFTRDLLMTNHLLEMSPSVQVLPLPIPWIETSTLAAGCCCCCCSAGHRIETAGYYTLAMFRFSILRGLCQRREEGDRLQRSRLPSWSRAVPVSKYYHRQTLCALTLLKDHTFQECLWFVGTI